MEDWKRKEKELLREKSQGNKKSVTEKRVELKKALKRS